MRKRIQCVLVAGLLCLASLPLAAAGNSGVPKGDRQGRLEQGLALFEKSDFNGALSAFQAIMLDPRLKEVHDQAAYWSALAFVGLKDYENADRGMKLFLDSWPASALRADGQYQQGRIAYLRKDYERSLSSFQLYLEGNPDHDLFASGLFWAGESMFQLGKLGQAEQVFRSILRDYPDGVKSEAANYRLSLIELKYREEELLKLLKWSHEESLRTTEEYQRREKTWEQAVNAYQRQVSGQKVAVNKEQEDRLSVLDASLKTAQADLLAKDREIADLKAALEASRSQPAIATPQSPGVPAQATPPTADAAREELLAIKEKALALTEYYLRWLAAHPDEEQDK